MIALKSDVEWAPHSPDLNPLDFWLWGAAKDEDEVYKARPRTLEALKRQVTEYVQQVPLATCRKVGDNFKVRVAACRRRRGGHIEHISYHKLAVFYLNPIKFINGMNNKSVFFVVCTSV